MKWTRRSLFELFAILVMTAVVVVLAVVQYNWTAVMSRSEQDRLKTQLETSLRDFDGEFSYDFERLCEGFEITPQAPSSSFEAAVARRYLNWSKTTSRPQLLGALDIWQPGPAGGVPRLESFDPRSGEFRPTSDLTHLIALQRYLNQEVGRLQPILSDRDAVYYPWTFYEKTPALIRPLFQTSSNDSATGSNAHPVGFLIIEINRDFLNGEYLPELATWHFGDMGLEVAIRTAKPPYVKIFSSANGYPTASTHPDALVNLFDSVGEEARRRGRPSVQTSSDTAQWQLLVQDPAGSLNVAVDQWRHRNLAISFGLLGILAFSAVLVFSVARRAERLAKLQMEFVAGVSHELYTPVAVINSAAENLVDGVVENSQQMREYGGMIRDQGRRLEYLLDQVLSFAAGQFRSPDYELRPMDLAPVIEQSLESSEPLLRDAGFVVEKEVDPALPMIAADPASVRICIENLLSNVVKYAAGGRWLRFRAQLVQNNSAEEVQISFEDRGTGIAADELPNIFEPFYRAQAARDTQARGVGLGLYLVKRIMESMGGKVTVSSVVGRGSRFVLHFPVPAAARNRRQEVA
jgi:signal transduction histidine kinase